MTLEQAMQLAERYARDHGISWKPTLYVDLVNESAFARDTPKETARLKQALHREIGTWQILVESDSSTPAGLLGFRVDDKTGEVSPIVISFVTRLFGWCFGPLVPLGTPRPVAPTLAILAVMAWLFSWILEAVLLVLQLFLQRRFSWQLHLAFLGIGVGLSLFAWLRRKDIAEFGYGCAPVQITPPQAWVIMAGSCVFVVLIFLIIAGKLN